MALWLDDQDEPTRPQPSAEPVAWMYEGPDCLRKVMQFQQSKTYMRAETETPLYPASALEAARREALEPAVEKLDGIYREMCGQHGADSGEAGAAFYARKTIYELKENPNG